MKLDSKKVTKLETKMNKVIVKMSGSEAWFRIDEIGFSLMDEEVSLVMDFAFGRNLDESFTFNGFFFPTGYEKHDFNDLIHYLTGLIDGKFYSQDFSN